MAKRVAATEPVEAPWALPEGWRWERLGDVAELIRGVTYDKPQIRSKDDQRAMVLLRGNNIQSGALDLNDLAYVDEACVKPNQLIRSEDVLLTMSSGSIALIGKSGWVSRDFERTTFGAFCGLIRASRIHARLLYYFLQTDHYRRLIRDLAKGTNINNLKRDHLVEMMVPVPPPNEQVSIVARVDELFTEIDDGEAALARARYVLATWRKALLKAAVTGELTADWRAANPPAETGADLLSRLLAERRALWEAEPRNRGKRYKAPAGPAAYSDTLPDGWTVASMPLLGDFGRGKSKHRPRNDPRLYGGPYPFVQTGIVSASRGKIARYDQTYTELGLAQSKLWPTGTLCITIAANIAKTGVLQFEACFPDSVVGLACAPGVQPKYVELVIRTLQQGLEDDAPATAQKNINLETLESLPIPLPPSSEQIAIVAAFEEAEAAGDLLMRNDVDAAAATLRQSILAAAFRGELA